MTPQEIADYARTCLMADDDNADAPFMHAVRDLADEADNAHKLSGRPIGDAADQVAAVAAHADQMLTALQAGWLWKILTITPAPKVDRCPTETTPTKKAEPCPQASTTKQ